MCARLVCIRYAIGYRSVSFLHKLPKEECHCEPVLTLVWQSVCKAFPHGEGGSRVSRKRETDEGLASPYGRGAPAGAERACFTLSVGFAASSPKVGAKGKRIVTGGNPWKEPHQSALL